MADTEAKIMREFEKMDREEAKMADKVSKEKDPKLEEKQKRLQELAESRGWRSFRTKSGTIIYQCIECQFRTDFGSAIKDHVNAQHRHVTLHCTECDFATFKSKTLCNHRREVHRMGALICPSGQGCTFKSMTAKAMYEHVEKKHPELAGQQLYLEAVKKVPKKERYVPKPKLSRNDDKMSYTILKDQRNGKSIFKCKYCAFECGQAESMTGHANKEHLNKVLTCDECHYTTYHPGTLYTHLKKTHKAKSVRCVVPTCKYRCLQDSGMQMHLWKKHNAVYDENEHAIKVYSDK